MEDEDSRTAQVSHKRNRKESDDVIDLTFSSPPQFVSEVKRRKVDEKNDFNDHVSISDDTDVEEMKDATKELLGNGKRILPLSMTIEDCRHSPDSGKGIFLPKTDKRACHKIEAAGHAIVLSVDSVDTRTHEDDSIRIALATFVGKELSDGLVGATRLLNKSLGEFAQMRVSFVLGYDTDASLDAAMAAIMPELSLGSRAQPLKLRTYVFHLSELISLPKDAKSATNEKKENVGYKNGLTLRLAKKTLAERVQKSIIDKERKQAENDSNNARALLLEKLSRDARSKRRNTSSEPEDNMDVDEQTHDTHYDAKYDSAVATTSASHYKGLPEDESAEQMFSDVEIIEPSSSKSKGKQVIVVTPFEAASTAGSNGTSSTTNPAPMAVKGPSPTPTWSSAPQLHDPATSGPLVYIGDLTDEEQAAQARYWNITDYHALAICNCCSHPGHRSSTCPHRACKHCGEENHLTISCPSWTKCTRCFNRGHDEDDCTEKLRDVEGIQCDYCGNEHHEMECENRFWNLYGVPPSGRDWDHNTRFTPETMQTTISKMVQPRININKGGRKSLSKAQKFAEDNEKYQQGAAKSRAKLRGDRTAKREHLKLAKDAFVAAARDYDYDSYRSRSPTPDLRHYSYRSRSPRRYSRHKSPELPPPSPEIAPFVPPPPKSKAKNKSARSSESNSPFIKPKELHVIPPMKPIAIKISAETAQRFAAAPAPPAKKPPLSKSQKRAIKKREQRMAKLADQYDADEKAKQEAEETAMAEALFRRQQAEEFQQQFYAPPQQQFYAPPQQPQQYVYGGFLPAWQPQEGYGTSSEQYGGLPVWDPNWDSGVGRQ